MCMSISSMPLCYVFSTLTALCTLGLYSGCSSIQDDVADRDLPITSLVQHPNNIAIADYNGDGAPDISVPNLAGGSFSIRLNNGDGTFGPVSRYPSGLGATSVVPVRLNGDNTLDVAVSHYISSNVRIFAGNGDGTFQAGQNISISAPGLDPNSVGAGAAVMISGDFNNDGKEDLATGNGYSQNISILLGNGDGTVQPARTYPDLIDRLRLEQLNPFGLETADFNEDGKLDLVTGGLTGTVIFRGNGDGSFRASQAYPDGLVLVCIHKADLNGDGHVDFVSTAIASTDYTVQLGNGDGSFYKKEQKNAGGILGAECFGFGDLNADNKLDLAVVNTVSSFGTSNVAILLGRGDGTFESPVAYPVGPVAWAASIADFNADGKMDVVVTNGGDNTMSLLFGNGDGTLQSQIVLPM